MKKQGQRAVDGQDATAADHEDIDLQVADNNEVAQPPQESESGDYDEEQEEEDEEYESEDEEGEDMQREAMADHKSQAKVNQAAAAQRNSATSAGQQPQGLSASQKLAKDQQFKAAQESEQKRKQLEAQERLRSAESAKERQRKQQLQDQAEQKQLQARKQAAADHSQPDSRLVSDDYNQDRNSHIGLIKGQAPSPGRPQNAIAGGSAVYDPDDQQTPTYAQYRQAAEFFDMTFKFETMINSMTEIFRVTAFLESLLFFVSMIFFFTGNDRSLWYAVLALFHVARSFIGFGMGRVVPSSYDFVEKLEFKGEKQLSYPQVRPALTRKVQNLLLEYYDDFEMVARLYLLIALVTFILDIISFFTVFGFLASLKSDIGDVLTDELTDIALTAGNPYLGRIFVVMVYTICDVVYILWILHFRSRMGETERGYVHKALLGFGNSMRIAFGFNPKGGKAGAPGGNTNPGAGGMQKNKNGARGRARD